MAGLKGQPYDPIPIESTFAVPPRYDVNVRIAIVGSGQSAIYTARKLIELGYHNITMFEKDRDVGGLTQSTQVNGKWYDYQAHLLANSYWGCHVHPETAKMLSETPWDYWNREVFEWRDSKGRCLPGKVASVMEKNKKGIIPDATILGWLNKAQIDIQNYYFSEIGEGGIGSMGPHNNIKTRLLLSSLLERPWWVPTPILMCRDWMVGKLFGSCFGSLLARTICYLSSFFYDTRYAHLVASPSLNDEWKKGQYKFNELAAGLFDTLLNSANMIRPGVSSAFVLRVNCLLQFNPAYAVIDYLRYQSINKPDKFDRIRKSVLEQLPLTLRGNFIHTPRNANYGGWNNWMKAIIDTQKKKSENKLKVLKDTKVMSLSGDEDGVTIVDSNGHVHRFDVAIITSRPKETREFVTDPILQDLFSEHYCPTVWTRSVLVKTSKEPALRGDGLGFWLMEPYASMCGSQPSKCQNFFTACNKQAQGDMWMCFSNCDDIEPLSQKQAFEIVRPQMRDAGFGEIEHVSESLSNWPVYARGNTDFYSRIKKAQGNNNVFIGGEIMSGPTLELIIDYVAKAVPYWFGVIQK